MELARAVDAWDTPTVGGNPEPICVMELARAVDAWDSSSSAGAAMRRVAGWNLPGRLTLGTRPLRPDLRRWLRDGTCPGGGRLGLRLEVAVVPLDHVMELARAVDAWDDLPTSAGTKEAIVMELARAVDAWDVCEWVAASLVSPGWNLPGRLTLGTLTMTPEFVVPSFVMELARAVDAWDDQLLPVSVGQGIVMELARAVDAWDGKASRPSRSRASMELARAVDAWDETARHSPKDDDTRVMELARAVDAWDNKRHSSYGYKHMGWNLPGRLTLGTVRSGPKSGSVGPRCWNLPGRLTLGTRRTRYRLISSGDRDGTCPSGGRSGLADRAQSAAVLTSGWNLPERLTLWTRAPRGNTHTSDCVMVLARAVDAWDHWLL